MAANERRFRSPDAAAIVPLMSAAAPPVVSHQRANGGFDLVFRRAERGTVLERLHQAAPLRILFPKPEPGEPPLAALLNCAGGLAGGDRLAQSLTMQPGAMATLSTAAAEKVYRSLGPMTKISTRIVLRADAALEWLPQETILFDGARLAREMTVELGAGAQLLATEILVFGRGARGELWRQGLLEDGWSVTGDEGPVWIDRQLLTPADLAAPFGGAGAEALGLLVFIGPAAETARDLLRDLLQELSQDSGFGSLPAAPKPGLCSTYGAVSVIRPRVMLGRWLGSAVAVRSAIGRAIMALRGMQGLPSRLPRLWST